MTDVDPVIHAVRIYTATVGVLVAVVGTAQIYRWRSFLPENQMAWLAVATFNFSAVFGTVDLLLHGAPGGARTYIAAVAVTFALYAVLHYPLHRLQRWWRTRRIIRRHEKGRT